MLNDIWSDMKITTLPRWLAPAPARTGDPAQGSIHADQWRSFCTVSMVVTLIRLWGAFPSDDRRHAMLKNFMDLVTATKLASMRKLTDERVLAFENHYLTYLRDLLDLFPGIGLSPNQHLSWHLVRLLKGFGPTHSWRTFAVERWNYMLQRINTNRKFGAYWCRVHVSH
ncbi:hypothetical protein BD410DRAFT_817014 [Rickenella mellea]|uniref:DUF4218 domain-containing protein n=1 Tax=Rickenella mellea TaxID=50990 RepID=A0A4Y7PIA6_9AGAM|nr:hypothetical protein BD410DRAFT_817014 [Rickenella mellea]